ncbi:MAG: adenine deaminase [Chloroflexota bacterium]|nr:MAG: adenine deaminase [Chloroflexota bacterium]
MELSTLIQSARGDIPADLLLTNGRVVNVFTGEIEDTSIAISDSRIVGLGEYDAKKITDLKGAYVAPGFIDAHVHIESALVPPYEFARAVVPHGVTTVVIDPHEIANVLGKEGIRYMLDASKYTPFSVYVMASSCVPATHLETSGATLRWSDLIEFKNDPWVLGLAEVMNYPGVINGELEVLDKLRAFADKRIDGHSPGLTGRELEAYVASGIASDHECTTVEEANEKLRRGMYVIIREASNAHNLLTLLPIINQRTLRRILFCTDDRLPDDLMDKGSIDYIVRTAIQHGLDPITAITIATLNAAEYFGLTDRGAIAPGKRADIVVFNNFEEMKIERVYYGGKRVVYRGKLEPDDHERSRPPIKNTMNVDWSQVDLRVRATPNANTLRIIGLIPGQLTTREEFDRALIQNGLVVSDPSRDILKMAVIERHNATGNVGLGFVRGFKLQSGAIGSSVGHDSHNILVVGTNDDDMLSAARAIASMQGGFVAVNKGEVLGRVPLPIGGLMSEQAIERVRAELDHLNAATRKLGCDLETPFMALSFLALPVIPDLKLTDKGLVDVRKFDFVDVLAD